VAARELAVTSVDTVVDGVHFRLAPGWFTAEEVGRRAIAAAISDIAAMGADPGEIYLALQLPDGFAEDDAVQLVRGAVAGAGRDGFVIVGGDVVAAPVLAVSVTAVGWAQSRSSLPTRRGAKTGDLVGVTGRLGGAGAALAVMQGRAASSPALAHALARARDPRPRLAEGRALAQAGVSAMIDVSDGLASDAAHIGRASGARLRVRLGDLPLEEGVAEVASALGEAPWQLAATAGEDYELCFCAPPAAREAIERALAEPGAAPITWIGAVEEGEPGAVFSDERGEDVRIEGYEHRW
jgi:thiamine-monophosphate kinase